MLHTSKNFLLSSLRPVLACGTLVLMAGCSSLGLGTATGPDARPSVPTAPQRQPELAAFSSPLSGAAEVPPVGTNGMGQIDAVLNRSTNVLRYRLTFSSLSGVATAAHFHGPAAEGVNAAVVVPIRGPYKSPVEGSATLTPAQAADLLAGRWYVNIHTALRPNGELRGQLILRQ
ncbi:CHRD domain-containing protein [Variovorax sp. HJSM1_2]|uniref:CHRD domain-containing protein n=1 Tax=Variovorax sp. HJSM1_2 TaxID=3366263 RepID=UPI003BCF70BF